MQGDVSLERTRAGLGVGLTLVRNLVGAARRHGRGAQQRRSARAANSRCACRSIRRRSPRAGATTPPPTCGRAKPLRILVADDNEDGREMLGLPAQGRRPHGRGGRRRARRDRDRRGVPSRSGHSRHRHAGDERLRGGADAAPEASGIAADAGRPVGAGAAGRQGPRGRGGLRPSLHETRGRRPICSPISPAGRRGGRSDPTGRTDRQTSSLRSTRPQRHPRNAPCTVRRCAHAQPDDAAPINSLGRLTTSAKATEGGPHRPSTRGCREEQPQRRTTD